MNKNDSLEGRKSMSMSKFQTTRLLLSGAIVGIAIAGVVGDALGMDGSKTIGAVLGFGTTAALVKFAHLI
jgi:hypothetical protein